MLLFVAARFSDPAELPDVRRALARASAEVPWHDAAATGYWRAPNGRAAVAWSLPAEVSEGYVETEPEAAFLFAGRPVVWEAGGECRGAPAAGFAKRVNDPAAEVDGRFAALRCSDAGIQLRSDGLGAYPVYERRQARGTMVSNAPAALRDPGASAPAVNPLSLSAFVGLGWSLGGLPLERDLRRVEPAWLLEYDTGWRRLRRTGPDDQELARLDGAGLDVEAAVRDLTGLTGGLLDWPGRPVDVGVTGGRDSRLAFLAAVATGRELTAKTIAAPSDIGFPNTPDVRVARRLAGIAGRELFVETRSGANSEQRFDVVVRFGGGLASLGDVGPSIPRRPRFELGVTGQGGEIARAYYGPDAPGDARAVARELTAHHLPAWPAPLVSEQGTRLVTEALEGWAAERAASGIPPSFLPDLFYLRERMGAWAADCHGVYEHWADTVFPLWSTRMLAHMLGPTLQERAADVFHSELTRAMSPAAWRERFAGSEPRWKRVSPSPLHRRAARARRFADLASQELRRRVRRGPPAGSGGPDPLLEAQRLTRERGLPEPAHELWELVSRPRAEALLSRDPSGFDPRSRHQLWRLISVTTYLETGAPDVGSTRSPA